MSVITILARESGFAPHAERAVTGFRTPSVAAFLPPSLEPQLTGEAIDADVAVLATWAGLAAAVVAVIGLVSLLLVG